MLPCAEISTRPSPKAINKRTRPPPRSMENNRINNIYSKLLVPTAQDMELFTVQNTTELLTNADKYDTLYLTNTNLNRTRFKTYIFHDNAPKILVMCPHYFKFLVFLAKNLRF